MEKYLNIEGEDNLLELVWSTDTEYNVTLKKDLTIKAKSSYDYKTNIRITPILAYNKLYCIPEYDEFDRYFVYLTDWSYENDYLETSIMNVTDSDLVLKTGTDLGLIHVVQDLLAKDPSFYYSDQNVAVKEIKKGIIKNFQYVIDDKNIHKLVLTLNCRLYDGPTSTTINLRNK